LVLLLAAIPLLAVTHLILGNPDLRDFRKGKLNNLSLTSDDELILARASTWFSTQSRHSCGRQ
jgi:hypothetical protein